MNNRVNKIKSMSAVNSSTFAEIGKKLAKKSHKHLIKRRRRTLEKREVDLDLAEGHRFERIS